MAWNPGRRARNRGAALVGLALLAAASARAEDTADPNLVYEFDTALAPVSLQGDIPLRLELVGGYEEGTLAVITDDRGRLVGSYAVAGQVLAVTGKVKYRAEGSSVKFTAKAWGDRLSFQGTLAGGLFVGTVSGKGAIAPGKNTFTLDASDTDPTVASVSVVFAPGTAAKGEGDGTLAILGSSSPCSATRAIGKSWSLQVRAGGYRWTGVGSGDVASDPVTLAWTASGYGAKVEGAGLDLALLPPPSGLAYADDAPFLEAEEPSPANAPAIGGGPVETWSVDPPLPAGLALDPATGVISGTPSLPAAAASYTVTAANPAGTSTFPVAISIRGNRAYSFAPEADALDDDDLRHFLVRTHFGVRGPELAALQAAGLPAYLDDQLTFPQSPTAIENAAFAELVNGTDPPGYEGKFPNGPQISRWWERIQLDTDRPMQEAIAFFWHDHMPVAWDVFDGGTAYFAVDHVNLYRRQGAGNFKTFLLAMARDPAMLIYLSGYQNNRFAPNENFAREFWELFTLGADNGYVQNDIVLAAKAWTGYRLRYDATTGLGYTQFSTSLHDPGAKSVFGVTIPAQNVTDDFAAVVDITCNNKPVAEFMTRKIFEYFCYESPPDALVATMAASLKAGNWELKPFFKNLFLSEAFFSSRSRAGRVKSPLEYGMGLMRSTGLKLTVPLTDYYCSILGQQPALPPTVNGWPVGTLWFSGAAMVNRTNWAYSIVQDVNRQNSLGMNVANILPPVAQRTDVAVLDTLEDLMRVTLTAAERTTLLAYLNSTRTLAGVVTPSPFDGSSQAHLDERVRGLIYILADHPTYHVK